MSRHDIVFAGAGHNNLVAAAYAARAGFRVLVLEGAPSIGGDTSSEELTLPGFLHDPCATAHNLIQSNPLMRNNELELDRHGLNYLYPDPVFTMPFLDGSSITMWRDLERTCAELARFSSTDADAYRQLLGDWDVMAPVVSDERASAPRPPAEVESRTQASPMGGKMLEIRRATAVDLLRDVGLLDVILPELSTANQPEVLTATGRPGEAAWVATLEVLDALADGSFPLTLAALLHAFVDAAASLSVCRRWKLSNRDTQRTGWLVEHQHALLGARHAAWPKLQRILISEGIDELLLLHEAIAQAAEKPTSDVEHCRELLKMPRDQLDPPPLLSGDDLIAHGVPRGKLYQSLLEAVRDAQLEKKITTKQQALALVDQLRAAKREDDSTPG